MDMTANAPHLPNGSNVDGYSIIELLASGETYYLYKARSPRGQVVTLREFCPKGLAYRDSESHRIRYRNPDPEQINAIKKVHDARYATGTSSEIQALGTSFLVDDEGNPAEPVIPQIATRQKKERRKNAPAPGSSHIHSRVPVRQNSSKIAILPAIIIAVLSLVVFLGYQLVKDDDSAPRPLLVKKAEPPRPVIEPEPVVEPEPEPEPEPVVVVPEPEPEPNPEPEPEPVYSPSKDLLAMREKMIYQFNENKGTITTDLQLAYADYAEQAVREFIKGHGGRFSPAFEEWLKKTGNRYDVFAAFYPPDPNVAVNVDILVNELKERAYTYDQLVLAFAIGRRGSGLGAISEGNRKDIVWPQPWELFIAGKPPINYFGGEPRQVNSETYEKVSEYLRKKNLTPKQAWINKRATLGALAEYGVTEKNLLSYLHEDMYRHNQMRRKRDPNPSAVDFFTYLVDKYEGIDKMRDVDRKKVDWDGVALDHTPWPVMLSLSDTRPLRECESVWDRYLGKKSGKRLWRYGPYRRDDDPQPPALFSLDPDPEWSMNSYDRWLHVGGMCGMMANMECSSRISLGSPAIFSIQPGHANLMYHVYNASGSKLVIAQSVDTTKNTWAMWRLNDIQTKLRSDRGGSHRFAEYHIGLALSLNLDEKDIIGSRLAMNAYKLVFDAENPTPAPESLKEAGLHSILKANPFYTEAWYLLFEDKGKDLNAAMTCIDSVRKAIPEGTKANRLWVTKKYNKSLGRPGKNYKDDLSKLAKSYTDTLNAAIMEIALKTVPTDLTQNQWSDILKWMRDEAKINSYPEVDQAYQIALVQSKGTKNIVSDVERDFDKILRHYNSKRKRKPELKADPDEMAIKINAIMMGMPEKDALPWIRKFVDECPEALRFKPKPGRRADITDFYKCVTDHYMKLAEDAEAQDFRDTLKKQREEYIASVHGAAPSED